MLKMLYIITPRVISGYIDDFMNRNYMLNY